MTTLLSMARDTNGSNTFGLPFADNKFSMQLAVGVAQSITVPSNYSTWGAVFFQQVGINIWVAKNATATYPTGAAAATVSEANPGTRIVNAGDTLSFVSEDDGAKCGVILYAIS